MNGLPVIVSYYTIETVYERMAARLRASCDRLSLRHHIVARESRGSWEANTFAKARVCVDAWTQLQQPILWVDADALVRAKPELLRESTADFAVHKWKGQYFSSGTVFFNQTDVARRLLNEWLARCETNQGESDQPHLEDAWNAISRACKVHTLWLPRSYYQIFDAPREDAPVIEHFQASRTQQKRAAVEACL